MPINSERLGDLKSHQCVSRWLSRCPKTEQGIRHEREIIDAAAELSQHDLINSTEQFCAAMDNAADAIFDGVKIFVSYKLNAHQAAAQKLVHPFKVLGSHRIKMEENGDWPFLCKEADVNGRAFQPIVYKALEAAHWFIILLPDERLDRSWTLFEAGFFTRAMHPGDRLICIRHPNITQAGPLRALDGYEATLEDLRRLYNRLLRTPGASPGMDTINAALTDSDLDQYINELLKDVDELPERVRRYYCNYLDLSIQNISSSFDIQHLLDTKVVAHRGLSSVLEVGDDLERHIQRDLDIVTTDHSVPLKSLLTGLTDDAAKQSWLGSVARAVASAIAGREPEKIDVIFRGKDQRMYRPFFHSTLRDSGRSTPILAHIIFHEALIGPTENAPREFDSLAAALRLGYSFYWEIIREFEDIHEDDEVDRLKWILQRIEQESQQRRLYIPSTMDSEEIARLPLVRAFLPEDRAAVVGYHLKWNGYRNEKGEGKLDVGLSKRKAGVVSECLREIKPMTVEFMQIASKRYAELVMENIK